MYIYSFSPLRVQMIAPKFVDLANNNKGKLVFLKVNVDECEVRGSHDAEGGCHLGRIKVHLL